MQIILSEAAKIVRDDSHYYIDTRGIWYKCRRGEIKFKRRGIYYTVSKKEIKEFAKTYKGNLRGPLSKQSKINTSLL